ncbi:hypothetical protein C8Q74DRAFT_1219628 [Fomes fomentarius]|nr:hypothetical protein C8Q74DRAFT_1219628 [Fomes fomentarius]
MSNWSWPKPAGSPAGAEAPSLAILVEAASLSAHQTQAAQLDGVQAMWDRFQNTIAQERESYSRLEESRKALLVQQRTVQMGFEDQRCQVQELSSSKKQLQAELISLKERLDAEILAKNDEIDCSRQAQLASSPLGARDHVLRYCIYSRRK